uniref:Uncharacterized protein n=1 Tax=uncultured prokaryote TaxID=198431 RepID=A0A0H5QNQ6_9ZZZZ|nr:hypothetical protein [uncultured prokaryote]
MRVESRIVREARLEDGRPAWPVAQALGLKVDTFRYRLEKMKLSPDAATFRPVERRRSREETRKADAEYWAGVDAEMNALAVMSDGSPAWAEAQRNGIGRASFRWRLAHWGDPDRSATQPPRDWPDYRAQRYREAYGQELGDLLGGKPDKGYHGEGEFNDGCSTGSEKT